MMSSMTNPDSLGVRHAFADVNGLRMHYVEKGEGPLVVLLHGFPEMWWSWRYQIPALVDAGYRVVAPDLRGYSETEAKGPYDVDTLRDDVVGLLDHLGAEKAILVAHDWGGGVAWHLASTRQSRCSKLVVMNCPHPVVFTRALFSKPSQLLKSWYMFFFQIPFLPEMILTRHGGTWAARALRGMAIDKTNFGSEELAPFAAAIVKPGRASAMVGWYRAAIRAGLRSGRQGPKALGRYETIVIPTLLLWGLGDTALGYEDVVPGTERYVPGIEVQTIDDCGHFVQQEKPAEVNRRLIEFLKRQASA
jgi:pimeloyl-ACP methyl ester carboxylesterase